MFKRNFGLLLMATGLIATIVQIVFFYPKLPDVVASHFGNAGTANDSMSKLSFFILAVSLQVGMSLMMLGLAWLLTRINPSLLNIPNREYWLADERRDNTIRYNQDMLILIGGITAIFIAAVFQLNMEANLLPQPQLAMSWFWTYLATYMVLVIAICGRLILRFSRPPANA